MEWNKEKTLFFIQLIRERPVLWDVTLKDHKNKLKKLDALLEIAKIFGLTKEEVNSKWTSLKGQYNREKKRALLKTGSGSANIYNSKWFAYQDMASLLSCNIPQESISNYEISPSPPLSARLTPSPPAMTTLPPTMPTASPSAPTPPPTSSTPPPLKFKKSDSPNRNQNSDLYEEAMLTLKAIKERKNKTESEDEITSYGLYIAAQMRRFQPVLQSRLKLDIQSLLCKYEIANIECTSRSASSMSDNSDIMSAPRASKNVRLHPRVSHCPLCLESKIA